MAGPRFDVITLFPDEFARMASLGVVGRALQKEVFSIRCWNPRDFTEDVHRTVDDRPYGGGPGMVMLAEPLRRTLEAVRADRGDEAPLLFLTPHGQVMTQAWVRQSVMDKEAGLILLCGRYEGVDQRFIDHYVDMTLCIGDFVLSGGELPAACLIDAWVRLLPGVLNHALSAAQDSFEGPLLDCPHYTRPEVFENSQVPAVLLSGNHAKIEGWRFEKSLEMTKRHRPDLLAKSSGASSLQQTPPSKSRTKS